MAQVWVEDGAYAATTNRLATGLTYDDAGNVTNDSRFRQRKYEYDANNRQRRSSNLDGSGAVESVHDGAGQRVAIMVDGAITRVMVYDISGGLVAEYGSGVSNNGTQYVMTDQQGSTRLTMTSAPVNNQLVTARQDYLPFGEELPGNVGPRAGVAGYAQTTGPRQKYAGMEQDEATGMSHTLWRQFDSLSARWTAPDPYGGSMDPGSPQSFNRYTYCNNDPVNKVNPAGLMLIDIGVVQVNSAGEASQLHFLSVHNFRYSVSKDYRDKYDDRVRQEQLEKEEREKGERKALEDRSKADFVNGLTEAGKNKLKDYFGPPPDPVPSIDPCNPALLTTLDADVRYINAPRSRDLYAPDFARRFSAAIREMNAAGIVPTINQSFRTAADQQRMVNGASGSNPAAAVGYSLHEAGYAVDINGTRSRQFNVIREIMERHGFSWGGRWPGKPDRPHFELNPFGPKGAKGTPQHAQWLSRVHDAALRAGSYYNQCFIQRH